ICFDCLFIPIKSLPQPLYLNTARSAVKKTPALRGDFGEDGIGRSSGCTDGPDGITLGKVKAKSHPTTYSGHKVEQSQPFYLVLFSI
ncbi:hypothetical protein, partial [Roseofilum sp. Guam]|uniref:hypothetical protein n=1 Tax=Roseofilum sp. Guam TaxID=2821502 RepID=UPI001B0C6FE4